MAKTFGFESTTDEVLEGVNLSGKRVLVTGVSAGLGVETARALVAHGATVVGTARDLNKARTALAQVCANRRSARSSWSRLTSPRSRASARPRDELLASGKPFDVIIANAGRDGVPAGQDRRWLRNPIRHQSSRAFRVRQRLVPLMKSGARIVTLSSAGHQISDVNLDDPNFERTEYAPFTALWPLEDRQHPVCGRARRPAQGARHSCDLAASGRNPNRAGPSYDAGTGRADAVAHRGEQRGRSLSAQNVPQGAATQVWASFVAPADAVGGHYCEDCHVCEVNDDTTSRAGVRSYALNPRACERPMAQERRNGR